MATATRRKIAKQAAAAKPEPQPEPQAPEPAAMVVAPEGLPTVDTSRVTATPTGLTFPKDFTHGEWVATGKVLKGMQKAVRWWIGDWLAYGEKSPWGEKYKEAMEQTGLVESSLKDSVWVAKRIEKSRRRDDLSWSHHREVASETPAKQDKLLAQAADENLMCKDLRGRMAGKKAKPAASKKLPKMYACPECHFTAELVGFKEVDSHGE